MGLLDEEVWKRIQERTLDRNDKKMFDEAKLTEIGDLEGSNAISFITDPEEIQRILETFARRIMPSRFILTKKQQEIGQNWKVKAMERYAPTPATPTVYLAFQILSSLKYELVIMDVSSAFGQSDQYKRDQGPLFATMPSIPGKEKHYLIRVLAAVYGLVMASHRETSARRVGISEVHLLPASTTCHSPRRRVLQK